MILAVIQAAIEHKDYLQIFELQARFDLTLKLLSPGFLDQLIESLRQESSWYECKLHLI